MDTPAAYRILFQELREVRDQWYHNGNHRPQPWVVDPNPLLPTELQRTFVNCLKRTLKSPSLPLQPKQAAGRLTRSHLKHASGFWD